MKTSMKRRDFALALTAGASAVMLGALAGCSTSEKVPSAPATPASPASPSSGANMPDPIAGIDYKPLQKPLSTNAPKVKAEMVHFFGYWCGHCRHFSPEFDAWQKTAPAEIAIVMAPVAFGNPGRAPLQRLFFTLRELGLLEALHSKVFDAVHDQRLPLFTHEAVADWAKKQSGVDAAKFDQVYRSASVDALVKHADQLTEGYEIDGVPSLGVAGKYYVDGTLAKSMPRALQIASALALKEAKA